MSDTITPAQAWVRIAEWYMDSIVTCRMCRRSRCGGCPSADYIVALRLAVILGLVEAKEAATWTHVAEAIIAQYGGER
jgi:hypothetical protein